MMNLNTTVKSCTAAVMEDTNATAGGVQGGEEVIAEAKRRRAGVEEAGEAGAEACKVTAEVEGDDRPAYATQYYAAAAATMGALALGSVLGYSSPAGPQLMANTIRELRLLGNGTNRSHALADGDDGWLPLTQEQYSWFSSSSNLGAAGGGLLGGLGISKLGRRTTMMASAAAFLCGWLMIALANNFGVLMCGRVLTGVCTGVSSTAAPPFIGEIASPSIRGKLGSWFQMMLTTGILFAFLAGAAVEGWRWIAVICTVPPALYFVLLFFTKESPSFLLAKGRYKEAEESLQYYRGRRYNIQPELKQMLLAQKDANRDKVSMRSPYILKPLVISFALMFFQQFSGLPAVFFNLATIFKESGAGLSETLSAILVSLVQTGVTCGATFLMDRVGRRLLLIFSTATMTFSIVCLGAYFYVREQDMAWAAAVLGWLPLTSLMVFTAAFSLGSGPVPWVMMGELFDPRVREAAASLATMVNWTSGFVIVLVFVPIRTSLGDYGLYWMFGGINIAALVFSAVVVPETKGKTLQEITTYFGEPCSVSPHSSNGKVTAVEGEMSSHM